jgi:hypothetical protein
LPIGALSYLGLLHWWGVPEARAAVALTGFRPTLRFGRRDR